jgi:hypothetical protein
MKHRTIFMLLVVIVCFVAAARRTEAARGLSVTSHDSTFVYGYSETSLTYFEAYYYNAVVDGYLFDQYGFLRDNGYSEGGIIAAVSTRTLASPGVRFDLFSDHYVGAYFYYCDYYCDHPQYYDYYGFSTLPENTFYGGYFDSCCYYVCYVFYYYIYLGTTGASVTVPQPCPNTTVEIRPTFGGSQDVINNQTRPALVGANVQLEAAAVLPNGERTVSEGSFQWSTTADAQLSDDGFPLPSYVFRAYWLFEGSKSVRVTYIPPDGSCQASASVNLDITTPTLTSFTAQMRDSEINGGAGCSGIEGISYTLGCLTNVIGQRNDPGISFTSTVQPPPGYISAPSDSKLKFVQLINPYSKRRQRAAGMDECQTRRGAAVSTEWLLDTQDPYDLLPGAIKTFDRFNPGAAVTIETSDSPGFALDTPGLTLDYLYADDQFEMYVAYFVGENTNPLVVRYLGYLPWSWGGEVVFDAAFSPPYRETVHFTIPGFKQGFAALNYRQPYQGNIRGLPYGSCSGGSEPPDPGPDPCWSGNHFICQ